MKDEIKMKKRERLINEDLGGMRRIRKVEEKKGERK